MSASYDRELTIALQAVTQASLLTKAHLLSYKSKKSKVSEETKADASEVTTADFAAQAVLISAIHAVFPDDVFIAEESGDMLRADAALCERVWGLVSSISTNSTDIALPSSKEEMVRIIDLGQKGGLEESEDVRTWVLDPIDGTKTYIRGQQYAVCLALVEGGEQRVGVLGCPNLNIESVDGHGRVVVEETRVELEPDGGWILSTVKGEGVSLSRVRKPMWRQPLHEVLRERGAHFVMEEAVDGHVNGTEKEMKSTDIELHFTDSSASSHTSKDLHNRIFEHFAHPEPSSRKMSVPAVEEGSPSLALDVWSMQFKYIVLVLRAAGSDAMIRVPPMTTYHACVWDHAGGQLLLTESGGMLTDANGLPFVVNGKMRKLNENWGVCAVRGGALSSRQGAHLDVDQVHRVVLERVTHELQLRRKANK